MPFIKLYNACIFCVKNVPLSLDLIHVFYSQFVILKKWKNAELEKNLKSFCTTLMIKTTFVKQIKYATMHNHLLEQSFAKNVFLKSNSPSEATRSAPWVKKRELKIQNSCIRVSVLIGLLLSSLLGRRCLSYRM